MIYQPYTKLYLRGLGLKLGYNIQLSPWWDLPSDVLSLEEDTFELDVPLGIRVIRHVTYTKFNGNILDYIGTNHPIFDD